MNKCCKWKCFFTPLPLNNWQWNLQECYDFVLSSFRPPVILVLKIRDPQISQNSFPIKRRFHDKRKADVKPPPRRSPQPLGWLGQASASPPSCYCCWGSQGNMATEDALSSEIVGRSPGRNSSFGNSKGKTHAKKKDPISNTCQLISFPQKKGNVFWKWLRNVQKGTAFFFFFGIRNSGPEVEVYMLATLQTWLQAKLVQRAGSAVGPKNPLTSNFASFFFWGNGSNSRDLSNWREAPFPILSCSKTKETQFFLCYHSNLSPWSLRKTILLASQWSSNCLWGILGGSWRKVEIQNKSGQHNPEHYSFKSLFS